MQICGCEVESVLEAAHIEPFANGGSFDVANGLVLRSDYHRLFDRLLLGIGPDLQIHYAPILQNTEYAQYQKLQLPQNARDDYRATITKQLEASFKAFQNRQQQVIE